MKSRKDWREIPLYAAGRNDFIDEEDGGGGGRRGGSFEERRRVGGYDDDAEILISSMPTSDGSIKISRTREVEVVGVVGGRARLRCGQEDSDRRYSPEK